jgi:hypothetical protein
MEETREGRRNSHAVHAPEKIGGLRITMRVGEKVQITDQNGNKMMIQFVMLNGKQIRLAFLAERDLFDIRRQNQLDRAAALVAQEGRA